MAVPLNVIVMWPGTDSSIPTGWSRVTDMDTRFPKGTANAANPDNTGGAANHTHGSSGHTHSRNHGHGATTTGGPSGRTGSYGNSGNPGSGNHTHTATPGSNNTTSGSGGSSWDSDGNDPNFFRMLFIESDGTPSGYPDDCVTMYGSASAPTDWTEHSGSLNRFPLGMTGGGNGGGTGGGGSHTHSAGGHTHTLGTHGHGNATTGGPSAGAGTTYGKGDPMNRNNHTHTMSTSSGGSATSGSVGATTSGTSYEPSFRRLLGIENTSGANTDTIGVIVMWLQTLASIPPQYNLCDGSNGTPDMRDRFIQFASTGGGDVLDTGGSDGHTHGGGSHSHSVGSHSHAVNTNNANTFSGYDYDGAPIPTQAHTHSGSTPGNSSSLSGAASVSSTSDTQPTFRTVAYIEQAESISAGGFAGGPSGGGYFGGGVAHF